MRVGDRAGRRQGFVASPNHYGSTDIDKPLEYTFGFQATPVKPALPDAWDYRIVHMGGYGLDNATPIGPLAGLRRPHHLFSRALDRHSELSRRPRTAAELDKLAAACHQRKIQLLLYFGYEMSNIAPEWDRYHAECLVQPREGGYKRKPAADRLHRLLPQPLAGLHGRGNRPGDGRARVDGVYLDGTSEPWGCSNTGTVAATGGPMALSAPRTRFSPPGG